MNSLANAVAGCGSSGRITIDLSRGSPIDKIVKALHSTITPALFYFLAYGSGALFRKHVKNVF
jgi:hypothetical protein